MRTLLVHYQELALKGRNRPWFVARLVRNVREACLGFRVAEVRPLMGRIEVALLRRRGGKALWTQNL